MSDSGDNATAPSAADPAPRFNGRALALATAAGVMAVIVATPLLSALGVSPRRGSRMSLQIAFILTLILATPGSWRDRAARIGVIGEGSAWKRWLAGFAVGALGLCCVTTALWIAGERHVQPGLKDPLLTALRCLKYVPLAPLINVLEDLFFFGLLYEAFARRLALTAAVYAWTHFIHIDDAAAFSAASWKNGFEAFPHMAHALAQVVDRPIEAFGLFLVGVTLLVLRRESGTLFFGAGVHAGWYFWRTAGRKFSEDNAGQNDRLFGTDLFYDGLAGWLLLIVTAALCARIFRARRLRNAAAGD